MSAGLSSPFRPARGLGRIVLYGALSLLLHAALVGMLGRELRFGAQGDAPAPTIEAVLVAPAPPPEAPPPPPEPKPRPRPVPLPSPSPAPAEAAAEPAAAEAPAESAMPPAGDAPAGAGYPDGDPRAYAAPENATSETPPAPPPGAAAEFTSWPPNAALSFKVEAQKGQLHYYGTAQLRWRQANGRYRIEQTTGLDVVFTTLQLQSSTSEGGVTSEGLAPERYTEQTRRRAMVATNFNREPEKRTITFSASTASVPLVPGAQDRASVLFQLAGLLRSQPDPQAVQQFEALLAGTRTADAWTFVQVGREQLRVAGTDLDALHFVREPRPGSYDSRLEIWYSAAFDWYPVRIRYTERNGDVFDLMLAALHPDDAGTP